MFSLLNRQFFKTLLALTLIVQIWGCQRSEYSHLPRLSDTKLIDSVRSKLALLDIDSSWVLDTIYYSSLNKPFAYLSEQEKGPVYRSTELWRNDVNPKIVTVKWISLIHEKGTVYLEQELDVYKVPFDPPYVLKLSCSNDWGLHKYATTLDTIIDSGKYFFAEERILDELLKMTESDTGMSKWVSFETANQLIKKWTGTAFKPLRPLGHLNETPFVPEPPIRGDGILVQDNWPYGATLRFQDSNGHLIKITRQKNGLIKTSVSGVNYESYDTSNPISPRLFIDNPDYFRLIFSCLDSTQSSYPIVIDNKGSWTGYLSKPHPYFKFMSYSEYVDLYTGMGLDFNRVENPLRSNPSDNAPVKSHRLEKFYTIWPAEKIDMNGDWMNVRLQVTEEEGWIRWRRGNQILIRLYHVC